jgi:hypothetical protein
MRRRYRRRTATYHGNSGHSLFGGTGWLFADLLLALALAFLLATTVGTVAPVAKKAAASSTTHNKGKTSKKAGHPEPALVFNYVDVKDITIDPNAILSGQSSALGPILAKIAANARLKSQTAGLVLLFAGDDNGSFTQWYQLDQEAWALLKGAGQERSLFKVAVPRYFQTHGGSSATFELQIYLFKMS